MMPTKISAFTGDLRLPLRRGKRVTFSSPLLLPLPLLPLFALVPELPRDVVDDFFFAGFLSATGGSQQVENLEADHANVAGTEGHDDVAGLCTIDEMAGDS